MSPGAQRAALHEHGGDRAAAAIELGLDHGAFRRSAPVGPEIEDLGLELKAFRGASSPCPVLAGDLEFEGVAAHGFHHDRVLEQLGADPLRLASGLSILLIATISGTPAALACEIASAVWGMTPSSAATTSTTISSPWRRGRAWP
jgi:hypothetical protein